LTSRNGRFAQSVGDLCGVFRGDFIRDPLAAPQLQINAVGFSFAQVVNGINPAIALEI